MPGQIITVRNGREFRVVGQLVGIGLTSSFDVLFAFTAYAFWIIMEAPFSGGIVAVFLKLIALTRNSADKIFQGATDGFGSGRRPSARTIIRTGRDLLFAAFAYGGIQLTVRGGKTFVALKEARSRVD